MDNFTLLPSANWNMSHMLVVNETGNICAYGSRGDILIIRNADKDNFSELDCKIISSALKNARVMGLAFVKCEIDGQMKELLASCGDDGRIKIWDYEQGVATHKAILKDKEITSPVKFVDIDYFPRSSCIVCITDHGIIAKWDLVQNKIWTYNVSVKGSLTCVAACPHADDLVAIGSQFGRVIVYSTKGEGKLIHRLLCHNSDVTSVSWCPVPYNVLQLSKPQPEGFDVEEFKNTDKTFLLASCCSDLTIYVSRAGTDNHCETLIKLPAKPLSNNNSRYAAKRNPNMERGRVLKWIYPLVMVTFTNFNEMISLYLSNFDSKSSVVEDKQSSVSMKVAHLKYDARSLHSAHKRNISSFAVCVFNNNEVDFRVWSYSFDKIIVRSGFRKSYKEKPMILPLLSGYIFSMDISCVNPDLLAIGTGDGKISIWNLSAGDFIDIKTLSKKIDHKVMSIMWHPNYEGIFAFGTYEGRVGLFDVSQGGYTPTLFKTFHQKAVYRLCWAPPIYVDESDSTVDNKSKYNDNLFLLAVVDGDVLQYNPRKMDELPVSLSQVIFSKHDRRCEKNKSDMCYEPNRDVIVIGYRDGEIRLFSSKSHELLHVVAEQTKTILSITWHPETVFASPNKVSPCRNWLAVAAEKVLVYDVPGEAFPKKVATLEVHTSRVLHIAWNPHIDGHLVTCSGDSTAIIWDVINQAVIGRYTKHSAQILCGLWSRTNKDIVITGSSDFTCRIWSVSKDTVSTVEEKKKNYPVIEPFIVQALKGTVTVEKPIPNKLLKNQTCFPSVSQEFHGSLLLDEIFERAIVKHDPSLAKSTVVKCSKHNSSIQNDSLTSMDDSWVDLGQDDLPQTNHSLPNSPETSSKHAVKKSARSYSDLFDSKEELINLMYQEERYLEETGFDHYLIMVQARDGLKNKIMEAMEKNKVTKSHLSLAASVSPKLYKDACHVYIEQMIHADNIFEAVNFQLALGLDSEAISLLCDKRRFREAFTIARLRLNDDSVVKEILAKWIHFCTSCGSYRLAAHCHMFLNEEEKASLLLSRSKLPKDAFLAARLLKFYQPERAVELATECFRRHLSSLNSQSVAELFLSFPELKFLESWYLLWKYFTEETPNTASITKWVIGILKNKHNIPNDFIKSNEKSDFEKLESAIVDNSFQMNSEELNLYVSAQAALYVLGLADPNHATSGLRHYVRALSMCYNFRVVNSNQVYSEKAYPMMRLLKLMFPKGILKISKSDEIDRSVPLLKSVNAYFCDFIITWLIACEELPKSLKTLYQPTSSGADAVESKTGDEPSDRTESSANTQDLDVSENIEAAFEIIVNKKTKMEKITLLLFKYFDDILDVDTVEYFKNVKKLKTLDSSSAASGNGSTTSKDEPGSAKTQENHVSLDKDEVSFSSSNSIPGLGKGDEKETEELSASLAAACLNEVDQSDEKDLRNAVERFERERMSVPNPFIFIVMLRVFLAKLKDEEPTLVSELEMLLETTIERTTHYGKEGRIMEDGN